jgi:hydroxyquinol 1,2-dioxygenase
VVASFANAQPERLREVMQSLARHLHAFAVDVSLTEDEWLTGIEFLTAAGRMSDERRQELILLSDVLGLSMLTIGINHRPMDGATESTVLGPFFVEDAPAYEDGADIANGAPGEPCLVTGRVVETTGEPVGAACVDVWQADEDGNYDVQYEGPYETRGRGRFRTLADGSFSVRTVRPASYPIPTDGPVGRLLRAARRSAMRPAHIHFRVTADGYQPLTTHVFAAGDPHLESDAVFGVKESLIAPFEPCEAGVCVAVELVLAPA